LGAANAEEPTGMTPVDDVVLLGLDDAMQGGPGPNLPSKATMEAWLPHTTRGDFPLAGGHAQPFRGWLHGSVCNARVMQQALQQSTDEASKCHAICRSRWAKQTAKQSDGARGEIDAKGAAARLRQRRRTAILDRFDGESRAEMKPQPSPSVRNKDAHIPVQALAAAADGTGDMPQAMKYTQHGPVVGDITPRRTWNVGKAGPTTSQGTPPSHEFLKIIKGSGAADGRGSMTVPSVLCPPNHQSLEWPSSASPRATPALAVVPELPIQVPLALASGGRAMAATREEAIDVHKALDQAGSQANPGIPERRALGRTTLASFLGSGTAAAAAAVVWTPRGHVGESLAARSNVTVRPLSAGAHACEHADIVTTQDMAKAAELCVLISALGDHRNGMSKPVNRADDVRDMRADTLGCSMARSQEADSARCSRYGEGFVKPESASAVRTALIGTPIKRSRKLPEVPRLRSRFRDQQAILGGRWQVEANTVKRFHQHVATMLGLGQDDWNSSRVYELRTEDLERVARLKVSRDRMVAAVKIQCAWASKQARVAFSKWLSKCRAAVLRIQRWWRLEIRFRGPLRRMIAVRRSRLRNVQKLQAFTRGHLVRRKLQTCKDLRMLAVAMHALQERLQ